MKIGIDIDNTLTTGSNLNQFLEKTIKGFNYKIHYDEYPIEKSLLKHGFIKNENEFNYIKFLHDNVETLYNNEQIFEGSSKVIKELKNLGFEIFYITARSPHLEPYTKKMFMENDIEYKNVYHLGSYDKTTLANENELKIFIEDNTSNIENLLNNTSVEKAILVSSTYNKNKLLDNKNVVRVEDWKCMLDTVVNLYELIKK